MEKIEIVFQPSDFENAIFSSMVDCALCRAIKRTTGKRGIVLPNRAWIGEENGRIISPPFELEDFNRVKSSLAADPSARHTLTLIKQ